MILYINLNPLEIKDKKIEKFIGYEEDIIQIHEPTDIQGMSPQTYDIKNIQGTNEKYIIFKRNSSVRFPVDFSNCQILIVGGGGSGGGYSGGGGGGGVVFKSNFTFKSGTYDIIIGNGGIAPRSSPNSYHYGTHGGNSSITSSISGFIPIYAAGGGAGIGYRISIPTTTPTVGSVKDGNYSSGGGGGAGPDEKISSAGSGNGVSGNGGGNIQGFAGGGGGAVGNGGNPNNKGGMGGAGLASSITGSLVSYGGGGGGSTWFGGQIAGTGIDGGGNGGNEIIRATDGETNRGGGGGGGWIGNSGGNGGSGVVIIRYTPVRIEPPPSSARNPSAIDFNPPSQINNIPTNKQPYTFFDTVSTITGTLNNYSQIGTTEDNENYNINFSSYVNASKSPIYLFSYSGLSDVEFSPKRYNQKTGDFDSSLQPVPIFFNIQGYDGKFYTINNLNPIIDGKIAGPSIRGEWISIKFQSPFALVSYSFVANLGWENKAPGSWSILGRVNNADTSSNIPYNYIHTVSNRVSWERYGNKAQTLIEYLPNNKELYNEYIFIFTRLASTDIIQNVRFGHQLHFKEIKMYSRAVITEN